MNEIDLLTLLSFCSILGTMFFQLARIFWEKKRSYWKTLFLFPILLTVWYAFISSFEFSLAQTTQKDIFIILGITATFSFQFACLLIVLELLFQVGNFFLSKTNLKEKYQNAISFFSSFGKLSLIAILCVGIYIAGTTIAARSYSESVPWSGIEESYQSADINSVIEFQFSTTSTSITFFEVACWIAFISTSLYFGGMWWYDAKRRK